MGRPKQLLPWDGRPLLVWQVEQLQAAGVDEVVVVLGSAAEMIAEETSDSLMKARVVVNDGYLDGRASSLRVGANAVPEDVDAVLVLSVDQPRPAWISQRLIDVWRREEDGIAVATWDGRGGHPILLSGSLLPELRSVTEEELGLRAVLKRHEGRVIRVEINSPAVGVDLNTMSDYEAALSSWSAGEWSER